MPANRTAPYAESLALKCGLIKSTQGFNLHEEENSTSEYPATEINAVATRKVGEKEPENRRIYIELRASDDDAHSGTFLRITENDEGTTHEAGSWALKSNELRLMIFAYEGPGNIDLGTVQAFEFARLDPDQISLADECETNTFQRATGVES